MGMLDGSLYGKPIKVRMLHDRKSGRFGAIAKCPECPKEYMSNNFNIWGLAKGSAIDSLREHYRTKHKG